MIPEIYLDMAKPFPPREGRRGGREIPNSAKAKAQCVWVKDYSVDGREDSIDLWIGNLQDSKGVVKA